MKGWIRASDVRPEIFTMVVCLAGSLGLFAYLTASYGLAWAWPFINLPLAIAAGVIFIVKLERVDPRAKIGWEYINKAAFGGMFVCLVAEVALVFLAPNLVIFALPPFLCAVWCIDRTNKR